MKLFCRLLVLLAGLATAEGVASLRLAAGNQWSGRLEVYYRGVWGTVCDDSFGGLDATVACKQLGFVEGWVQTAPAGSGQIWLDDVACRGTEAALSDCSHRGWGSHNCRHSEDVGIYCTMTSGNSDSEGQLRIVGEASNIGRLEVQFNGNWGLVCDDSFSGTDARVACRQLGYPTSYAAAYTAGAPSNTNARFMLDDLACSGSEGRLKNCRHSGVGVHDCSPSEAIGVYCRNATDDYADQNTSWPVRLSAGSSGRLQIRYKGVWGTVCDDSFGADDALVVCRQLGYPFGAPTGKSTGSGIIWMDDVRCTGAESALSQCAHRGWGVHNCGHSEDVTIACTNSTPGPVEIRLQNGDHGRLEVKYAGIWGTVCDDSFGSKDAQVICRMLGHEYYDYSTSVPAGTGPIWLDNLACDGTEDNITDCRHNGWGTHNCRHSEDVGVDCRPGTPWYIVVGIIFGVLGGLAVLFCTWVFLDDLLALPGICLRRICRCLCLCRSRVSGGGPVLPPSKLKVVPETVGADLGNLEFPEYWTNIRSTHRNSVGGQNTGFDQMIYVNTGTHFVFDELMQKTYKSIATQDRPCPKTSKACSKTQGGCPCVRPGGSPGLPTGYVVRRVIRVENSEMWRRYCGKRDQIQSRRSGSSDIESISPAVLTDSVADGHPDVLAPLDEKLNEVYLWHGTGTRMALSIAQNDFNINLAGTNKGTMYGRGAYMSESSTKADEYALDERGGYYDGIFALLLVRACLGKYHYTTDREPEAGNRVKSGQCDSVLGDRASSVGTYREFVVYDSDQVYPEFVVLYQRIHQADNEVAIRAGAKLPFHMELPVYWSNCHRNPHKKSDAFAFRYTARQKTKALLQRLVEGTTTKHRGVKVVDAFRIEVSWMWNRYVDFKNSVAARDIPTRILTGDVPPPLVLERRDEWSQWGLEQYTPFCSSDPLPAQCERITFSCQWKDQDVGDKTGRARVKLMRSGVQMVVFDLFGVCRSDDKTGWKDVRREMAAPHPVVVAANEGDVLTVECLVGGGDGHELHIKDFKCTIYFTACLPGGRGSRAKVARCMQPNELDGMEETGHALTSLVMDELDAEDCISADNLDSSINEMFLWHGTSSGAADAIITSGFRIPHGEAATHGKRFGEGAYFAEDLSKSLDYTKPTAGIHHVLLCRTLCGELYYTEQEWQNRAHVDAKRDGKDSVLANPSGKGPREFIVLKEAQVYPEFYLKLKL